MTPETVGPLSRPVPVAHLPEEGVEVEVEATEEERSALAKDFKLPAIHELRARFRLSGSERRVHVDGQVEARISQICIVTLDLFDTETREQVEVDFAKPGSRASQVAASNADHDAPDEITGGAIDVGALAAEFLALGLDPYPRKPGATFSFETGEAAADSPFAGLKTLKEGG